VRDFVWFLQCALLSCVKHIGTENVHRRDCTRHLVGLLSSVGRPCSSVRPAIPCVHTLSFDRVQVATCLNTSALSAGVSYLHGASWYKYVSYLQLMVWYVGFYAAWWMCVATLRRNLPLWMTFWWMPKPWTLTSQVSVFCRPRMSTVVTER